jgi:transposase
MHPHAAGIDVGATMHMVAVPPGADREGRDVRSFGAFTCELLELCGWLVACGVTTAAIESTGVYWIPLYDLMEEHGIEVYLVDARQIKRAPGRKTDVLDCQLLQQEHTFGRLARAFRPPEQICALRSLTRQRDMLVRCAADHIQHIQKALTQMNVKLQHVVSDIMGKTGQAIIRALVGGERDPEVLARLRDRGCRRDAATIAKALQGTWREEHLLALRQALQLFDTYQRLVDECDTEIERRLRQCAPDRAQPPEPAPRLSRRRRHGSALDLHGHLIRIAGVDPTRIEGISTMYALKLISEVGTDTSHWPSHKHFTSWLGLCPGIFKSGGRRLSGRTKPTANRAAAIFRMAAYSLLRSNSALGAFLRRKAGQIGMPKAITATAHKLARLFYSMLKYGTEYVIQTQHQYEQLHRERLLASLERRAKSLGFKLIQEPTPA